MKKTPKPTKCNNKVSNKVYDEEYTDLFFMKVKPVNEAFIERLGKELLEWAINDEEALKITTFFRRRGIGSTSVKRWKERSSKFKIAYEEALGAIGDRREIGALKKKFETSIVNHTMPHYDEEWKQIAEWRARIKEDSSPETKVIVLDNYFDEKSKSKDEDIKKSVDERKQQDDKD